LSYRFLSPNGTLTHFNPENNLVGVATITSFAWQKLKTLLKQTKQTNKQKVKKVGDMAQVVEHLPSRHSKHKALSSIPSTTGKGKVIHMHQSTTCFFYFHYI
jgi:hypothetical protein